MTRQVVYRRIFRHIYMKDKKIKVEHCLLLKLALLVTRDIGSLPCDHANISNHLHQER